MEEVTTKPTIAVMMDYLICHEVEQKAVKRDLKTRFLTQNYNTFFYLTQHLSIIIYYPFPSPIIAEQMFSLYLSGSQ